MKRKICAFLFCLVLLRTSAVKAGPDPVAACNKCYQIQMDNFLKQTRELEDHFLRYRSAESRLRWLYYEKLWQARRDANDHLSKPTREKGKATTEVLDREVVRLETLSKDSSNGFVSKVHDLQTYEVEAGVCGRERAFHQCLQESFQPVYDLMETLKAEFDHVFESERDYRIAVEKASGGRDGLYPEDTLEKPGEHKDFYSRFERERSSARFEADRQMTELFHRLTQMVTDHFSAEKCCYRAADGIEAKAE